MAKITRFLFLRELSTYGKYFKKLPYVQIQFEGNRCQEISQLIFLTREGNRSQENSPLIFLTGKLEGNRSQEIHCLIYLPCEGNRCQEKFNGENFRQAVGQISGKLTADFFAK